MLASAEPLDGLRRSMLIAALQYAEERIVAIQEVKRRRKEKGE